MGSFVGEIATSCLVLWAGVVGLLFGSFANVIVYRLPRGALFSMGSRSHCPLCGALIPWHANLPVLSFLALRGRCRSCLSPIPLRYPLVELAMGGLFALVAFVAWGEGGAGTAHAAGGFLLSLWLLTAAVIDLEHRILPDALTLPGLAVAPVLAFAVPGGLGWPAAELPAPWGTLAASGLGMVVGGGALWVIGLLGRLAFHKEAMGLGDVKLLAFLGGFLGPFGALLALLLACLAGALVGGAVALARRDPYLPFGPCLAGAALAVYLSREALLGLLERAAGFLAREPAGTALLLLLAIAGLLLLRRLGRLRREEPAVRT